MTKKYITIKERNKGKSGAPNLHDARYVNVGRRAVIDKEVISKLEAIFMIGGTVAMACFNAKIAPATYYRYIDENPDFKEHVKEMKNNIPNIALHNIAGGIVAGDIPLSERVLAKRMPNEFGDVLRVEDVTNRDGKPEAEDAEIIKEYHEKLKQARLERSKLKAIEEGELKK